MPAQRDEKKAVKVAGRWYPLFGVVEISQLGIFVRKFTVGDATADSDDYQSSLILTNFSGGIGIEDSDEGADTTRYWWGINDSRSPNMLTLPPLVTATKPAAASGTCYPVGVIGTQFYAAFDDDLYGWKSDNSGWHTTANDIVEPPVGKSILFDGRVFIPQGSSGHTYCTEMTANTGTLTDAQEADPKAQSFAIWNNNLYAIATDGVLWKLTQGADPATDWHEVENSAGVALTLHTGETPKTLVTYFDRQGSPTLWLITDRSAYMYYESAVEWRQSTIQFPPHPDFGRAAKVWRTGEDLWITAASDVVRQTTGNAIVPLGSGISRDQGVPKEFRGTIKDLEPEISTLYALMGGTLEVQTTIGYQAKWGTAGSGNTNFTNPGQVAIDASGNIYIADNGNSRIKKHQADGTYTSSITSGLGATTGVAVDASGNIYVVDSGNTRIKKFNSAFTQQWSVVNVGNTSGETYAGHIATDGTYVYASVINTLNSQHYIVRTLASTGSSVGIGVSVIGSSGTGDGQFNTPVGVATDGTYLYVVDQGNDRVQKFTTAGVFVTTWGSSGTGNGQFQTPVGVAINPVNGNVLVTDSGRDDVQEFTNTGVFVRKFAASGSGNGFVSDPTGIVVTADGASVYVAEQGNDRVQQFDYDTATAATNAYPSLLGWNGVGWHPFWAGTDTSDVPTWATVSATLDHYRLWWGMDDGNAYYLDLRRTFHNPRQGYLAGVDRFAETGYLLTSKFDASMLGFDKVASHVTVFADNATTDETITIEYSIDEGGWEPLGSVTTTGHTHISFGAAGRVFNTIQFRVTLARGSTVTNTPVLKALTLLFVKIPQNARSMIFTIVPSAADLGSYGNRTGQKMFTELDDLNDSREFFDVQYRGVTYEHCRIAGIRGHDNTADDGGQRTISIIGLPVGNAA